MANELLTRNTKMAVMLETVSGQYVNPANENFMPILDSSETTPGYDTIESNEMSAGLDKKPGRPTTQTGQVTIGVKLKGGTNGATPHYDALLRTVLSEPTTRANKTTTGQAALAEIAASPTPTTTTFDIGVASAFLAVGDVILVDVSAGGTGTFEQATVLTATFTTDHQSIVLESALSAAPATGNAIQLISRIEVGGSPGYVAQDCLMVEIAEDVYDEVIVLSATGTTTQSVKVWPYLSAEPLTGATVIGGKTYKCQTSGQPTVTVTEFDDCDTQDGVRFDYAGCRMNMTLESAEVGSEPELKFAGDAAKFKFADAGTNLVTLGLVPNTGPTHYAPLCLGMNISLGDRRVALPMQDFSLDMGYEIGKRQDMTQESGTRGTFFKQRQVGGSFTIDMLDASQYRAWLATEDAVLVLRWQDANQTIVLIVPYLLRESIDKGDKDGIRTNTQNWKADVRSGIGPVVLAFFPSIQS